MYNNNDKINDNNNSNEINDNNNYNNTTNNTIDITNNNTNNNNNNNNIKIDTVRLWKLFINRDFFTIKNLYIQYPKCDMLKRKYIIKWVIETTYDFNSALAIQQSFDALLNFFNTHKLLIKHDLKNIHLYKTDKNEIRKDIRYNNFEYYFTEKINLMKIIFCINNNIVNNNIIDSSSKITLNKLNSYIYINNIDNNKLQIINQRLKILNDLDISYLDYELIGKNIRVKKIEEMNFKSNECKFDYILKNISTDLLLFLFINDIIDIDLLIVNKYGTIIITIPFKNKNSSSFTELIYYKKLYTELLKRIDFNDSYDKFKNLDLSGKNIIELENIKKIIIH